MSQPQPHTHTATHTHSHTATATATHTHTHTHTHTRMWQGCPTEVSIGNIYVFPGSRLCLPSVLLTAVPSALSYPTPGLLMDTPHPSKLVSNFIMIHLAHSDYSRFLATVLIDSFFSWSCLDPGE